MSYHPLRTDSLDDSLWVFLLLAKESIRTYRANPHLVIASWSIPTWIMPLVLIVTVAVLVPGTSLLGHLCAVGVGYLCKPSLTSLFPKPANPLQSVLVTSSSSRPRRGLFAGSSRSSTFWQFCPTTSALTRRHMDGSAFFPPPARPEARPSHSPVDRGWGRDSTFRMNIYGTVKIQSHRSCAMVARGRGGVKEAWWVFRS